MTVNVANASAYTDDVLNPTQGSVILNDLNNICAEVNANGTLLTSVATGAYAFAGVKTFNNGIATDTIAEKTAGNGVSIDGVLNKDGSTKVSTGTVPTTVAGNIGYYTTHNLHFIQDGVGTFYLPKHALTINVANYSCTVADHGKTFQHLAGTTVNLPVISTIFVGWTVTIAAYGAGVVTVDPDSSGTIEGSTTRTLTAGQAITIICSSVSGSGAYLIVGASTVGGATGYIKLQHQEASGTNGGTFNNGSFQTRPLTTEVTDTNGDCTLASNQFVLVAGTYEMEARAAAYFVGLHQLRIRNITDSSDAALGLNAKIDNSSFSSNLAVCAGRVTISASKTFELQHRCGTTRATDGFGVACSFGTEVYAEVIIRRVA